MNDTVQAMSTSSSEPNCQLVLAAPSFDETIEFLTLHGFRIDQIFPADDPATAILSAHGITLRLERTATGTSGARIRIEGGHETRTVDGPDGLTLAFQQIHDDVAVPDLAPGFVFTPAAGDTQVGRAGMVYRDLIPNRLGGRFIASHITITDGGPVPDYVHHHHIRFQMIFCHRGWVDVVYEDQGPPFRLEAGDAVLQPPHIRHRVLESSANCEVVEIGCPAEHQTIADHTLELPTPTVDPDRDFGGQKFVRHHEAKASWQPMTADWAGWVTRDTGVGKATSGVAGCRVIRPGGAATQATFTPHEDEFRFHYVRRGTATLLAPGQFDGPVEVDDSFVIPAGQPWRLHQTTEDFELLEVTLPAQ